MTEPTPAPGEVLTEGLLYRRIPNWEGRWDADGGLPGKEAFDPGRDRDTQQKETGISAYLVRLTDIKTVLEGYDQDFGVVIIDITDLLRAVAALRPLMGTGRNRVRPFGNFAVTFDPLDDPRDGPARHAHCWIDPVPGAVQKELVRLTSPARVAKPCGPIRPRKLPQ